MVEDLHIYVSEEFSIELKVLSKTEVKDMKNGDGRYFGAILSDASGAQIRASFFGAASNQHSDLGIGKAYRFHQCRCRGVSPRFETRDCKVQLTFNSSVDLESVDVKGFKNAEVRLTKLSQLRFPATVDVQGLLVQLDEEPNERGFIKGLLYSDNTLIQFTWFEGKAAALATDIKAGIKKFRKSGDIIVTLTSMRTSQWRGGYTLATTSSSTAEYKVAPEEITFEACTFSGGCRLPVRCKNLFHKALAQGLQESCFVARGMLSTIMPENFSYADKSSGELKYSLKIEVADSSEYVTVTAFDDIAREILGMEASEAKALSNKDHGSFISKCQLKSFRSCIFALENSARGWICYGLEFVDDNMETSVIMKQLADRFPADVIPAKRLEAFNINGE